MKLILDCFTKNWANFRGRASRKEYWLFYLTHWLVLIFAFLLDKAIIGINENKSGPLLIVVILITIIPNLSAAIPARKSVSI